MMTNDVQVYLLEPLSTTTAKNWRSLKCPSKIDTIKQITTVSIFPKNFAIIDIHF